MARPSLSSCPVRRRSVAPASVFPSRLLAASLVLLGCVCPGCEAPGDAEPTTPHAAAPTVADAASDAPLPGPAAATPPQTLPAAASPAAWFSRQLVGVWQAITVRYPGDGAPQASRHTYNITSVEADRLIIEASRVGSHAPPSAAWARYIDLPAMSGVAALEYRQGPVNDLDAAEAARTGRGVLHGRTLLLEYSGATAAGERRCALLGDDLMLTLIELMGQPAVVELAVRGAEAQPPDPGPLEQVHTAAAWANVLAGDWRGDRYHAITGSHLAYARSVEPLGDGALLVHERLGGVQSPAVRVRRLRLTPLPLDGVELLQTAWAEDAAAVSGAVRERAADTWRGGIAGNVITWTERFDAAGQATRLECHWLVLGRDLVVRVTQESDGSWWYAVERRTNG